jgi:hypothetical protein
MSNQFGQAGKSVRDIEKKRQVKKFTLLVALVVIIIAGVILIMNPHNVKVIGSTATLIGIGVLYVLREILFSLFNKRDRTHEKMIRGAEGEELIGRLLAQLGPDYLVWNDVKSPYGNIDHIVYNKRGCIFLIETKSHYGNVRAVGGKLLLDGAPFEKDILQQTMNNAYWVREKVQSSLGLTTWVTPVIVFTRAFVEVSEPVKGVNILYRKVLLRFIENEKHGSPAGLKLWELRDSSILKKNE